MLKELAICRATFGRSDVAEALASGGVLIDTDNTDKTDLHRLFFVNKTLSGALM
ncbi:Uncharacterized [Syntrophomonas zehnderi OL-4]|uniref:Uncharacterized n=1 Tax=Syntrophomonas zehnderi OL-4 TaxID=690567 RepID=A0A0E4GCZ8_9FIRM|nr:Uncharacterized [Syntrophomonas zehnderi OL-4]CFX94249.1 Uncharacterized [Syntrophomonas zehnderi OL-4]